MASRPALRHAYLRYLPAVAAALAAGCGVCVLIGWLAGWRTLTSFGPGLPSAPPLAALFALVGSAALALQLTEPVGPQRAFAARLLAWVAVAIGAVAALAPLLGTAGRALNGWLPRPFAGVAYTLLGVALLLLDRPARGRFRPADGPAFVAGVLASAPMAAYASDLDFFFRLAILMGLALPSALVGFLLAGGILLARPGRGLVAALDAEGPAGLVARRFLPAIAGLPIALWLLREGLAPLGITDPAISASFALVALVVLAIALVLWSAIALEDLEAARRVEATARARLADMVEAVDVAVVGLDVAGRVRSWNRAAERLYGVPAADAVGNPMTRFVPKPQAEEIDFVWRRVREGSPLRDYDTLRSRRDGTTFQASLTVSPLYDVDGELEGLVEVVRDVSEQRRLEAGLRLQELRLRSVIETAHDAILFLDGRGRVTEANPRAESIFGRPRHDLLGSSLTELVSGPGGGGGPAVTADAGAGEVVGRRADGSTFPAESSMAFVETTDESFSVAFVRDVTERKRVTEDLIRRAVELEQAHELDRIKDHIFSTMSHETRPPLSLIQGYAELLQDRYPDEQLLGGLLDGVARLTDQLDAILDYAALVGAHMPIYHAVVDAHEAVAMVQERYQRRIDAHELAFTVELPEDLPGVQADPRRLDQVLAALLDNALKFTPRGGKAGLRVQVREGDVCFEVWDAGSGIDEGLLAHLGEPFRQADMGDSGRLGGLGLGLAIATRLAVLQHGTLTLAPRPGGGTSATLCLPAAGRT